MIDGGEGFIEMMQSLAPFLIFRRAAKAHRVIFQRVPIDEDQILPGGFQAALQRNRLKTLHGADERHGVMQRRFVVAFHARFDMADERFQNHFAFCRMNSLRPPSVSAAAIRAWARSGMMNGATPASKAFDQSRPVWSFKTRMPKK